jgi:glycine/D-amino acid oxidase-like deaminating enzyme
VSFTDDVLILGHGIAGAVLAETLRLRGLKVHVFDRKRAGNASMAAAGVVNPVVLRRDVPSWRAAELLPIAQAFYTAMEQDRGASFWHPIELVKLFPSPKEAEQWQRAMRDPGTAPFVSQEPQPEIDAAAVLAPHGHGTVTQAAWLDVPAMLDAQREALLKDAALSEIDITQGDITCEADRVRIGDRSARWLVRCEGSFSEVHGLVPVKGEGLTVRIPGLRLTCMLHRGVFLLPTPTLGDDVYRVGATFKWDDVWEGPTDEGRRWLLERIMRITSLPVEVLDHWSGVRPASRDRRPVLGVTAPQQAVFNGLGSRGVLLAPWCAAHLADHLFAGAVLDPEVDVARFG